MKIVAAVRCFNEEVNIRPFIERYSFADQIIISDGGSTDNSPYILKECESDKVKVVHFWEKEVVNGQVWNPDHSHINFVLDEAKGLNPDFLLFDDMDCYPNKALFGNARHIIESSSAVQINVFRVYMWGRRGYFPAMNNHFDPMYTSLWGWKPKELDIRADPNVRHGTIVGTIPDPFRIELPNCLLHYSWNPYTVQYKVDRYNALGLPMQHPLYFAGEPKPIEDWMT